MGVGDAPMDFAEAPMAFVEPPMRFGKAHNTSHEVATGSSPGRQPGVGVAEELPEPRGGDGTGEGRKPRSGGRASGLAPGACLEPGRSGSSESARPAGLSSYTCPKAA
jgi:hypothetical protein